MAENTAIQTAIENAVNSAQSSSVDGMSVSRRSIPDLIAADNHVARKNATASSRMGVRFGVLRAPEQY